MQKLSTKEILGIILAALLFLGASYGSERFADTIKSVVDTGSFGGMLFYVGMIITIVLIPLGNTLPLVPVAVAVWGNLLAGLLTIIAFAISSNLCIHIARRFGRKLVLKVLPFKMIKHFGDMVPQGNLIGGITVLAMLGAPVDILSYAVGLFTHLNPWVHSAALVAGAIPFIFFLTYTATLPIVYQTYIVGFMIIVWFIAYSHLKKRSMLKKNSEGENGDLNKDIGLDDGSDTQNKKRKLIQ